MTKLFSIFLLLIIPVMPVYKYELLLSVYYPIVGESKNLSPQEKTALEASRKRVVELAKKNKDSLFINGPTNKKVVALTFDDGPDASITPAMLNVLKSNNVKGAFFFVGNRLDENKDIAIRADREGNLVLNHSYSHPEFIKLSTAEISRELLTTEDKIYSLIGRRPAIMRPPYGEIDQATIDRIVKNNYKIVMWSIDTMDWSQRDKENIIKNAVSNVRPGDIISFHSIESNKSSLEALSEIINRLKGMGYEITTVDKLLGIAPYK